MSLAIILFCKEPTPGLVKTRLAQSLFESQVVETKQESLTIAAQSYQFFCQQIQVNLNTLATANLDSKPTTFIFYHPGETALLRSIFVGNTFVEQSNGDLGQKLKEAFDYVFELGFQKVICLGTDSPDLNPQILLDAFEHLNNYDTTFGPSEDGGYYLVGLSKNSEKILSACFENIPWSTDKTLETTLRVLKASGFSFSKLPTWYDIDSLPEFRRFLRNFNPSTLPFLPESLWSK